jgi:hypothetical protein
MNGHGAVPEYDEPESMAAREKQEKAFRYNTTIYSTPTGIFAATNTGEAGRKFDIGKLQYGLVPPNALKETVKVLTAGAEKYDKNNWQIVPDAQNRYFDALQRHLWDWKMGHQNDPETNLNHLAHVVCNALFLLERDLCTPEQWENVVKK